MTSIIVGPIRTSPRIPNTKAGPGLANSPPATAIVIATKSGMAQSKNL